MSNHINGRIFYLLIKCHKSHAALVCRLLNNRIKCIIRHKILKNQDIILNRNKRLLFNVPATHIATVIKSKNHTTEYPLQPIINIML